MNNSSNFSKVDIGSERSFGIVFAFVFIIIAIYPILNEKSLNLFALIISIVFFLLAIFRPKSLISLNLLWHKFGMVLGGIVAPVVMFFVFFLTVVPTGLIMRLLGKDLLTQKINKNAKSYWINREKPVGSMKRQF
tara:strand:+ start:1434 stop:1838 length:405 start_codon:yes stop_codon:yes gene_type:complete